MDEFENLQSEQTNKQTTKQMLAISYDTLLLNFEGRGVLLTVHNLSNKLSFSLSISLLTSNALVFLS